MAGRIGSSQLSAAARRGARTAGEKCPGARGNRGGAGRAPYEIGQNVCFTRRTGLGVDM